MVYPVIRLNDFASIPYIRWTRYVLRGAITSRLVSCLDHTDWSFQSNDQSWFHQVNPPKYEGARCGLREY
jgi:hypothetical protein